MAVAFSLLQLVLCAAIALRAAGAWSRHAGAGRAARWLAAFVVFFAALLGVFLALGLAATLTGAPLLRRDLAAALTALAALAVWRATSGTRAGGRNDAILRGAGDGVRFPGRAVRLIAAAVAVTFLASAVFLCCGFPRGYEPRGYHLPIAVQMFRTRNIQVWDREYMETLPANASLYYGDLLGILPERLVSASDLPFLAALILAAYLLGRSAGADASASLVAACGLASIPLVSFSALETGADLGGIAFLGAAAYFALAGDVRRRSDLVLAGLAGGLAFGFKSVHLVAIGFLAGAVCWRRWKAGESPGRGRESVAAAGLFLALVLALASPWLVRNQREFHNPLYPVYVGGVSKALGWPGAPDVDYGERRAFQFEWVRSPAEWAVYPWIEWHKSGENFKHSSGLGPFFAGLVVPALVVAAFHAIRTRGRTAGPLIGLLAGTAAVLGSWWLLGDHQPRYAMGSLVFAVPLAAWTISQSRGGARRVLVGISAVAIVLMAGVVLSYEAVEFGARFLRHRQWTRHAYYGYPAAVDRLPDGTVIANLVSRPENYGLFGARHSNRVVNARTSFRMVGVDPPAGEAPTFVHLSAEALRRLGVRYLYLAMSTALETDPDVRLVEVGRSDGSGNAGRRLLRVDPPAVAGPPLGGFRETRNRLP